VDCGLWSHFWFLVVWQSLTAVVLVAKVRQIKPAQLAFVVHYNIVVLTYLLGFRSIFVNLCDPLVN